MNDKVDLYSNLILKFNKKLNLISPKDIQSLKTKHISDAEESFRIFMDIYGHSNDYSAYDLGSGNGTPGIVWAILDPSRHYTLVEIDQRKSEFLKHCKRELTLENVTVLNKDFTKVDYVPEAIFIARAFMNLNKLFSIDSPAYHHNCFLLKGSTWNNELEGIEHIDFQSYPYMLKDRTERNLLVYRPK